jgi:hypothetical protein
MAKLASALALIVGIGIVSGVAVEAQAPKEPPAGPPGPGMVIPPFVRDGLKLSQQQDQQVAQLEQDVKARLKKILTDIQMGLFEEAMRQGPGDGPPKGAPGNAQGGAGAKQGGPPGGPPGPGMGPPSLVVPPFVVGKLQLKQQQSKQIAELDRSVQTSLNKILTPAQSRQFLELLRQGPGKNGPGKPPDGKGQAPPN